MKGQKIIFRHDDDTADRRGLVVDKIKVSRQGNSVTAYVVEEDSTMNLVIVNPDRHLVKRYKK